MDPKQSSSLQPDTEADDKAWVKFKSDHDLIFENQDEDHMRKLIFLDKEISDYTKDRLKLYTPDKLDYCKKGNGFRVSRVKDHRPHDVCYSYSTLGAVESYLYWREGSEILLSEQNLIDCAEYDPDFAGGYPDYLFEYIMTDGIMTSDDYPYTGYRGTCKHDAKRAIKLVRRYQLLPKDDEYLLQVALHLCGPIPVAIAPTFSTFNRYPSGVYFDKEFGSGYDDGKFPHSVLVVGYDTDPEEGDYWKVKNSWGKQWGQGGFMRIARNRGNHLSIATFASLPFYHETYSLPKVSLTNKFKAMWRRLFE